jgi:hypothetical protein
MVATVDPMTTMSRLATKASKSVEAEESLWVRYHEVEEGRGGYVRGFSARRQCLTEAAYSDWLMKEFELREMVRLSLSHSLTCMSLGDRRPAPWGAGSAAREAEGYWRRQG